AVDEARVDLGEDVVAEAEALHRAGAEVLDEHVGLPHERLDHVDTLGRLQIEGHAAFVPVEEEVRGGLAVLAGRPGARLVARVRVLHLDDVGAEVSQQCAAPGPRNDAGEVEHADAVEREGECRHGRYYTAGRARLPGRAVRRRVDMCITCTYGEHMSKMIQL